MTDQSDIEQLTPQLIRGDEEAFRGLVRALGEPLFAFAVSRTRDAARAQDLVQTAFIRVYRQRASLQQDTLRAYCYRIVENLTRDNARDSALRAAREREAASMRPDVEPSDPERRAMAREAWQAALNLPLELRDVVLLHHGQGLSLAEAGAVLDIPKGTVQTRLQRALDSLREKLGASLVLPVLSHVEGPGAGLGELLGKHAGFAAPVAAPPSFISSVETAVMASIAQKSAVSAAAILIALLLMIGGGVGLFFYFGGTPRPPVNQLASLPDKPALPNPSPTVEPSKTPASSTNLPKIDTSTPGPATPEVRPPVVAPTPTKPETPVVAAAKNPRGRTSIDYAQYTIRVKGRAIDPDGNPVTMADIKVHSQEGGLDNSPGPLLATGASDANGAFDIAANLKDYVHYHGEEEVRYLRVYLVMTHPVFLFGCQSARPEFFPEQHEYLCDNILIKFDPPIRVRVAVVDENNAPVPGASVGWGEGRYEPVSRTPDGQPLEGKTDSTGVVEFRLPVLPDDVISLEVHGYREVFAYADGYLGACARVEARPNKNNAPIECTLKLRRGCEVTGIVEDESHMPIPYVSFNFDVYSGEGWFIGTSPASQIKSDATGQFRTFMAPGEHEFEIVAKGFVVRPAKFKAPTTDLRIMMMRLHKVSLTIVDEGGPCRLWSYDLRLKGRPGDPSHCETSGMFERFEHDGLPARSYTVTAHMEGWDQLCEFDFDVNTPGDMKGEVHVNRPAGMVSVRGRVVGPDGAPIANAEIKLAEVGESLDDFNSSEKGETRARTRNDGTFALPAVRPGKRVVRIRDWKHPLLAQEVEFKDSAEFTFKLEATGRLLVKVPATPEAGALYYQVLVINAQGHEEIGVWRVINGQPHIFEDLPAGRTRVRIESPSWTTLPYEGDPLEKWVDVAAGQTAEVVFDAGPTITVAGTLTVAGKAPQKANVRLYRIQPGTELNPRGDFTYAGWKSVTLDEAGNFEAIGMEPGDYWVLLTTYQSGERNALAAKFTVIGQTQKQQVSIDLR